MTFAGLLRLPRRLVDRLDNDVDHCFDRLRGNPAADRVFYAASEAGNFSGVWHGLAWLAFLRKPSTVTLRQAVGVSVALGAESVIVNGAVKSCFRRQRPGAGHVERPHRLRTPRTSSFPSGHASAAMVGAAMLTRRSGPLATAGVYTLAGIVALSRIHVRMHHASDVVAGLLIGCGLGKVFRRLAS